MVVIAAGIPRVRDDPKQTQEQRPSRVIRTFKSSKTPLHHSHAVASAATKRRALHSTEFRYGFGE